MALPSPSTGPKRLSCWVFDDLNYNVVYAQMGRGKTERVVAMALAGVAETLGRLSMDALVCTSTRISTLSVSPRN